jgi:hypothetical protein
MRFSWREPRTLPAQWLSRVGGRLPGSSDATCFVAQQTGADAARRRFPTRAVQERFLGCLRYVKEFAMPNDTGDLRTDTTLFPSWGMQGGDTQEGLLAGAGLWLTGGATLLMWTALALLLTA